MFVSDMRLGSTLGAQELGYCDGICATSANFCMVSINSGGTPHGVWTTLCGMTVGSSQNCIACEQVCEFLRLHFCFSSNCLSKLFVSVLTTKVTVLWQVRARRRVEDLRLHPRGLHSARQYIAAHSFVLLRIGVCK